MLFTFPKEIIKIFLQRIYHALTSVRDCTYKTVKVWVRVRVRKVLITLSLPSGVKYFFPTAS